MVTADVLKSMTLFAGLPEGRLAALARGMTVRRFPRGALIVRSGDKTEGVYIILSGRAKVLLSDAEGREVILAVLGPLEFFGEMGMLDDHPRSAGVQALGACEVMCLPTADFLRCLAESRELSMSIMRGLAQRLRQANRQIESLALLDVYGRVARLLLDLAEDTGGERVIQKAPAKQEIAHMIGASREMVSRVIRDLRNRGHISVDKRRIVILEKAAPVDAEPQAGPYRRRTAKPDIPFDQRKKVAEGISG